MESECFGVLFQLMKLQSRFKNDERFKMDEKFIDASGSEDDGSSDEENRGNLTRSVY